MKSVCVFECICLGLGGLSETLLYIIFEPVAMHASVSVVCECMFVYAVCVCVCVCVWCVCVDVCL